MMFILQGRIAGLIGLIAVLTVPLDGSLATDYFVSKTGDDSQTGLSREKAFATVQKGVDALAAGDTLTIGPGEYLESVQRSGLGTEAHDTVIQAELPGSVVLRGDVAVGPFRKVSGTQFVYETDCDRSVQAINEVDTLTALAEMPNVGELDAAPARWHYDREKKKLYVSSSDWGDAQNHRYTASVIQSDGLYLNSPRRVVINGLVVRGFNNAMPDPWAPSYREMNAGLKVVWGILIFQGQGCVVRNCTAFLNGGGIGVNNGQSPDLKLRGRRTIVEGCTAYGNHSKIDSYFAAGIGIYCSDADEIRDCYVYRNNAFGARFYGAPGEPSKIIRTLAWGNWGNLGDFQLHTGESGARIENSVSLGGFSNIKESIHSITGTQRGYPEDNISLLPESGAPPDLDREFADPANFDFRLQGDSRFRSSGPGGKDRGPYPYEANVFYVGMDGDDLADGLSIRGAWKTLARATKALRPGDTLYLQPGIYAGDLELPEQRAESGIIAIRGRGVKPVVIQGGMRLKGAGGLEFERLNFFGEARMNGGGNIAFRNCGFTSADTGMSASGVKGLSVTHCQFTGFQKAALVLNGCQQVNLSGNLYDNSSGFALQSNGIEGIRYSDYNSYTKTANGWEIAEELLDFTEVQMNHEQHSLAMAPVFTRENDVPVLQNRSDFLAVGPLGKPIGPFRDEKPLERFVLLSGPEVHSVSATTANIKWKTSLPATCTLAWGETPECTETAVFDVNYSANYSLTGLKPGQAYYFKIKSLRVPDDKAAEIEAVATEALGDAISFATLEKNPAPRVYRVDPDGDDRNSGLDRASAWRTIQHAANNVNVGDTVLVAAGKYPERVRLQATGEEGLPITFKAVPGEKVVMDGVETALNSAFVVAGKSHLVFDGFTFLDFNRNNEQGWHPGRAGEFNLYQCRNITVSRCFSDGRSGYTAPFLNAWHVDGLLMKNCVVLGKFVGLSFAYPTANVRIENNVFAGTLITHAVFGRSVSAESVPRIEKNIFTDNMPAKAGRNIPAFNMGEDALVKNNCFYLRSFFPPDKRFARAENTTFQQEESAGLLIDPLFANPRFSGVTTPDPAFKPSWDMGYAIDDSPDRLMDAKLQLNFSDFFATDPELVKRGIGLQPEAFRDFHFQSAGNP